MEMNLVLAIGIIIVIGLLGGLVTEKLRFPRITGYIIIGILLSPSLLNVITATTIENLSIIIDIALGIIAFMIGGSLRLEPLRKLGRSIAWITSFQSLGAWLLVIVLLTFLSPFILTIPNATLSQTYFPMAFIIGAVSCATAPAVTMAIINEGKSKGPLTTTLLAVVAMAEGKGSEQKEFTACKEPRPQMCTREYRPVCAKRADGSMKTYSNGCTACTDPKVVGYYQGACD